MGYKKGLKHWSQTLKHWTQTYRFIINPFFLMLYYPQALIFHD